MYALLGLVLLAIRRVSDRTVFALVLAALLLPGARSAYSAITQEPWPFPRESMPARYEEETRIYRSGTYAEQVGLRSRQMTEVYGLTTQLRGPVMFYSSLLLTMLLGFYVGRKRMIQDLQPHIGWIKRVMVWCLAIGLSAAAIGATLFQLMEPTGRGSMLGFFAGMLFAIQRPLLVPLLHRRHCTAVVEKRALSQIVFSAGDCRPDAADELSGPERDLHHTPLQLGLRFIWPPRTGRLPRRDRDHFHVPGNLQPLVDGALPLRPARMAVARCDVWTLPRAALRARRHAGGPQGLTGAQFDPRVEHVPLTGCC